MNVPSRLGALRWAGSLAAVLTAHAGAVAAFMDFAPPPEPPPPPPQAVMMVELAPNVAAPRSENRELAPGPQRDRARPQETTPETPPEKQRVKDKVVAKSDVPLPAKAQPKPKKPKAEPQTAPPVPDSEPQEQRPAAEAATAPPALAAPEAPTATAPAPGVATVPTPMNKDVWRSALLAHIQRHLRYPGIAQARRQEGVAWVQFAMTCQGKVLSSSIQQSSNVQALDREALAVLERAQPLPAPSDRDGERIHLAIPVTFNLP